jgi:hypothetical protein
MTKLPASLRAGSALAIATAALAMPAPALAGWDRIEKVGSGNVVDQCGALALRASDNRALVVPTGSTIEIEVLGHGIDLVKNEEIEFNGGGHTIIRRHGGAQNVTRKCGPIGSVKLRLTVNRANPEVGAPAERNYTLRIGGERIRVTAVLPGTFQNFGWDRQSFSGGSGGGAGGGGAVGATGPVVVGSGQSCAGSQSCGGGGTTGVVVPPQGPAGSSSRSEFSTNLRGCIAGRGGDVRMVGNRLVITLPDDRNAVRDCITNATFARVAQVYDRLDITSTTAPQIPAIRYSVRGGEGARARPASDPAAARFSLDSDFAMRMVGVQDYQLVATNFASRQLTLDVRVQSTVPYGVTRIAPAALRLAPPTSIRPAGGLSRNPSAMPPRPTVAFDIDLAPSDVTSRPLEWSVAGAGGACFTAASGILNPPAGAQRVSLILERVSATACAGQNVAVSVAPQGRGNIGLYAESTAITLN